MEDGLKVSHCRGPGAFIVEAKTILQEARNTEEAVILGFWGSVSRGQKPCKEKSSRVFC
jgi:hypothetical protein